MKKGRQLFLFGWTLLALFTYAINIFYLNHNLYCILLRQSKLSSDPVIRELQSVAPADGMFYQKFGVKSTLTSAL